MGQKLVVFKGEKMSLEHAQDMMNGKIRPSTIETLATQWLGSERHIQMLQARLLLDLIEEVRWLRTGLYNIDRKLDQNT